MADVCNHEASVRILICERETMPAKDMAEKIVALGYEVSGVVACAKDALRAVQEAQPDLVLMAIDLEGEIDGVEAADRIRGRMDVPVIYLTASAEDITERARRTEPCGYVYKPVGIFELRNTLEIALRQRDAAKRLKDDKDRFRALVENAKDIIFRMSLQDGAYEYVSPASIELLGYSPDEFYSNPALIRDIIHPDWLACFEKEWDDLAHREAPSFYEYQIVRKSGEVRWVRQRNTMIYHDLGQAVAIEGIVSDITQRKRVEEALRTSEAQLTNALEMANLGPWEYDVGEDLFKFNDQFYKLYRTTAEQVGGYAMSSDEYARLFLHPEEVSIVRDEIRKAVATDDPCFSRQLEHSIVYADGEVGYITVRFFIVKDALGRTVRTYGVNQDITERKKEEEALRKAQAELETRVGERAFELQKTNKELKAEIAERIRVEEALRESEFKYRELVENANSIILRMDRAGNVSFFNEFAQKFFGYTEEEILGRNVVGTIVPEIESSGRDLSAMIEDIGRRPHLYVANENENMRSNGERVWVSWTNRAIPSNDGGIKEILCVGNDITALKQAKEALQAAYGELENRVAERTSELASRNEELKKEIEHRKIAQTALENSEERYRRHFASVNEVIFSYDAELKIQDVSPASERLIGYSREELVGRSIHEVNILHPDYLIKGLENAAKLLAGNSVDLEVYGFIAKDGTVKFGEVSGSPIWKDGKVVGAVSVARDVTTRIETEQALQQSEHKQQEILESIEEGYYEVDLSGDFVFFNKAMEKILGYTTEDLMGMNNRDFMDPATAKEVYQAFNRVYTTGKSINTSGWELVSSKGDHRHIETSVSLISSAEGTPLGFRGIVRDVTSRKRAEDELRKSEEKYRTIIENMDEGYFEVDLRGNMTLFNDSACRILGYPREELKGLNYRAYMERANARRVFDTFNQVYKTGDTIRLSDWEIVRKDGTLRIVDTPVSLIRDGDGQPIGFRGLGRDVTDKHYAAEALKKAHDDLERRVEQRTTQLKRMNEELERQIVERRQAEERYRTLVEVAPVAINIQTDGKIVFANPEAVRAMAGESAADLIGKSVSSLLEPDFQKLSKQRTAWMLQHWKPAPPVEISGTRLDGTPGWARVTSAPVMYEGNPSILVVAMDITERKNAEEQLRASIKEKEVLLREIHHRVKNNLQVMASLLALQSSCCADDLGIGILKEAENRIWSMAVAHETLYSSENLDMINAGDYLPKLTEVVIGAFGIGTPHVIVSTQIEDVPLRIDSAVNCGLILNELVTNCFKHAFPEKREGHILIRFRQTDSEAVELEVSDDGIGIPEDISFGNTGSFGWDLVKTLVGDLRGDVSVIRNQGAKVRVSFVEGHSGKTV